MTEKELEKQRKLDVLQRKHRKLMQEREPLLLEFKKQSKLLDICRREYDKKCAEIKRYSKQIYDLKQVGQTPHVTDHAIVRYLERVEGLDIWELKAKVARDKNAVQEGNVIVTVNEDLNDEQA